MSQFEGKFFANIESIFLHKGRFVAEAYFEYLKPTNDTSEAAIGKYEALLDQVRKNNPDNSFLIDLIKDTISDLKIMGDGQRLSTEYLASKKK